MPAGDDRRPRRRPQGAHRPGRRVPTISRVVGGPSPQVQADAACAPRCWQSATARSVLGALRQVFPRQRTALLVPQISNVLAALPKSRTPARRRPWPRSGCRGQGPRPAAIGVRRRLRRQVPQGYREDRQRPDQLLAFYDYPAEHWVHLRTTNPIESTFATVRHRSKVTRGPGSRAAGLAMAFKLIESAQTRWRLVDAPPFRSRPSRSDLHQRPAHRTSRRAGGLTMADVARQGRTPLH